jgi:hypothetical protein
MFTSVDKAIVAFIASVVFFLNQYAGISIPLSEGALSAIGVLGTTLAVWLVPNKS